MTSFFKNILFLSFLCLISPIIPSQEQNLDQITLEQLREEIEIHLTEIRTQTKQIGYVLESLINKIQLGKISLSSTQKIKTIEELICIKDATNELLEKIFIQANPDLIAYGHITNNAFASYLLKTIKNGISKVNIEQLFKIVNLAHQKSNINNSESLQKLVENNQSLIQQLLHETDLTGLTWYNKTYKFLKNNHGYDIARATSVVLLTAIVTACIYKNYNKSFNAPSSQPHNPSTSNPGIIQNMLNKIGTPSKIKYIEITGQNGQTYFMPEVDPITNEPIKIPGSGIFKVADVAKAAHITDFFKLAPICAIPVNDYAAAIYAPYWNALKTTAVKYWRKFDNFCSGAEEKYEIGECEKVYFKDMTGVEHLEDLAKRITNYLQYPERYERSQIEEHRCILLHGPPQTGKTLFVKALKTMIDDLAEKNHGNTINFFDVKRWLDEDTRRTIDDAFYVAGKYFAPCIFFIDEIDLVAGNREKDAIATRQLLTNMQGIDMASKKIFIIGATNKLEQLDSALLVDGRFGKMIHIGYPTYPQRKSYLEHQLAKRYITLDPAFIDCIAQETEGASYNMLKRLITESLIISTLELRPVTQNDFEHSLDVGIRKIEQRSIQISQDEKRIIAAHQAGKALMRHLLQTKQQVVKITILPVAKNVKTTEFGFAIKTNQSTISENEKLAEKAKDIKLKDGEVFTKTSASNMMLISDQERKKEIMTLLAGNIAQNILFNESYSQCNPQDRADAMQIIYHMISQGELIDKTIKTLALELKAQYEKDIEKILTQHKDMLTTITNTLVAQNSIDRYEWIELINNYPTL